ncbi:sulfotransferase family 2 domain-containing protein [Phyllobacterium bourgognense]|uniref:Sulfotransferase family protein n=1 Tax=Phyllobacterium bourgognense TaxID=314236 RepID=A0A368YHV3_9HYPH|nr:sulfotransferase family 2 domain-containing protein [Phyllobacterium bourgognense]RCW77754.1 sulfotransferase family protein [Phyllobacterium bourgognense]
MIISYRHKFTFLHCPKTAGSSINMALVPHLGPFDILLGSERERADIGAFPNLRARLDAVQSQRMASIPAALAINAKWSKRAIGLQNKRYQAQFGPIVDHPSAEQVRSFDEEAWKSHYKFTFIRNPYKKIVSMYIYLTRKSAETRDPFSVFVRNMTERRGSFAAWHHLMDSWPIYTINDRVAVDFIGRHETLATDFNSLCDQLNISQPKLGAAKVAQKYDFREFYDAETRNVVRRHCEREIDYFGYRFDD